MTDLAQLGRRAVACKHWRWMPGMLSLAGGGDGPRRVAWRSEAYAGGIHADDQRVRPDNGPVRHNALPDLDDPATLGCVLALAREAWGDSTITTDSEGGDPTVCAWWMNGDDGPLTGPCRSEADALVSALERAP